jgi:hypothetical protein
LRHSFSGLSVIRVLGPASQPPPVPTMAVGVVGDGICCCGQRQSARLLQLRPRRTNDGFRTPFRRSSQCDRKLPVFATHNPC